MPYKVIAHRRPEALGGRQHPFQTAPAVVADDQGRLGIVHDAQRQFVPLPPEGQREVLSQLLGEPHNWISYPRDRQPDWVPGSVVKSDASGGSYLDPNEPVLTPDAEDEGGAGGIEDGGEDDGAVADTNVLPGMAGPPNTAPRQQGKMQVMRGKAKNDGEPFDYRLPLTTCVTCVNLQPVLLQIKPCRMPAANINLADFGYYNMVGGCPYYQFGMSIPPGGDDSDAPADSPATSADVSDTIQPGTFQMAEGQSASGEGGDTPDMVRGALIQLLGGQVTGRVSRNVTLVGPPTTTDDGEEDSEDDEVQDSSRATDWSAYAPTAPAQEPAGGIGTPSMTRTPRDRMRGELHSNGEDYALHEELGSFAGEPTARRVSTSARWSMKPLEEGASMTSAIDQGEIDDEHREWYDGEHQSRATGDADTEALIDKCDSLPSETRLAVIQAVRQEHSMNGGNFDAAVRTFRDYIEAAEPDEDIRDDYPGPDPNAETSAGMKGGVFSPDAFPAMRSRKGD